MTITVGHYPRGTSKGNKRAHGLFAFLTQHWRGTPLVRDAVMVRLLAGTTNTKGLWVEGHLGTNTYDMGITVSDSDVAAVRLPRPALHGEWDYAILPAPAPIE